MKKILTLMTLALLLGCSSGDKREAAISALDVSVHVKRFDLAFAAASQTDLPVLKEEFPYLFNPQYSDSVWYGRMEDSLQQQLSAEVMGAFEGFDSQTRALTDLFKHVKYYFPDMEVPTVVTLTSYVDYPNRVIYADTLLLLSLDAYLGADHEFYAGIQEYIRKDFEPSRIPVDVAEEVSHKLVPPPFNRTFLDRMVYFGKRYYLMQRLLPAVPEELLIGFDASGWAWATANESEIWRYFIENDLLYSTESKLDQRFLDPAPFSKFYLEFDNETPGRLGRYIGWQIVRAYMENNEVSLQEMLEIPAENLFKESRYKPEK